MFLVVITETERDTTYVLRKERRRLRCVWDDLVGECVMCSRNNRQSDGMGGRMRSKQAKMMRYWSARSRKGEIKSRIHDIDKQTH